ncbi:MAG: T9SS type A sorting domain-containing protein [Polaribacter sp.]
MKTKLLLLLIAVLPSINNFGQTPQINWDKTIGGTGVDYMSTVIATSDGGYALGGDSKSNISGDKTENSRGDSDYWIVKLKADRTIEWQKTIGGSGIDIFTSMVQTSDGGYFVGGYSLSNASGDKTQNSSSSVNNSDYWVVKLSASGVIEWQKTLGGDLAEELHSVAQTSDGGYILGGHSNSNISGNKTANSKGGSDYWIVKLTSTGTVEWQKTIGGSKTDRWVKKIFQTQDGGYVLGGQSFSGSSASGPDGDKTEPNRGNGDYWVLKLSTIGNIEWQKTIGGSLADTCNDIIQSNTGGFLVIGSSDSGKTGDKTETRRGGYSISDVWIVKLDNGGDISWDKTIGGTSYDYGLSAVQDSDNNYILGMRSNSNTSGEKTEDSKGFYDFWVLSISESKTINWQKTIGGGDDDDLLKIIKGANNDYVLAGNSGSNISGDKTENSIQEGDYWIVNLQLSGTASVEDNSLSEVDVYPNPATDIINIKGIQIKNVGVYNLKGQNILNSSNEIISLKELAKGMYLLKITDIENKTTHKKIIVR